MKNGPKRIECQEDNDFMTAFDKMMEDTSKARNSESLKVPQFDVSVPVNLKGSKKKFGKLSRNLGDFTGFCCVITEKYIFFFKYFRP